MRNIGTIVKGIIETVHARQVRNEMIAAHAAAEKWHYWMGRALRLQIECEEYRDEHRVPSLGLEREYREARREAAAAMQDVPLHLVGDMYGITHAAE